MTKFAEHLRRTASRIMQDFEDVRRQLNDSDAKGGANESIVAEFIKKYMPGKYTETNCQIIDTLTPHPPGHLNPADYKGLECDGQYAQHVIGG